MSQAPPPVKKGEEGESDPPQNFTAAQLRQFDGTDDEKGEPRPLYLSADGIVFDASDAEGRSVYGPNGPYHAFAGKECGAALAKGCKVGDDSLLGSSALAGLGPTERAALDDWVDRLTNHRQYPVLGRLVPDDKLPSPDTVVSKNELAANIGKGEVPDGYAFAPIFLCLSGKVYDVSFGGVSFYGPGGGYACFAGKDASRALAKMSFDPKDTENPDTSDLTEKERKILSDWVKKYEDVKRYPCVGRLDQ